MVREECEQKEEDTELLRGVLLFGRRGEKRKHNIREEKRERGRESNTFSSNNDAGPALLLLLSHSPSCTLEGGPLDLYPVFRYAYELFSVG